MSERMCSIDGCGRPHLARSWCDGHYRRWKKYGNPLGKSEPAQGCSFDGCEKPHYAKGYCRTHRARLQRHGDTVLRGPSKSADWVTPECKVDGCHKPAKGGQGWCRTHYQRWYKRPDRSDPAQSKYILGTEIEQFWAKVNKDGPVPDYAPHLGQCWLWTAALDTRGYGHFRAGEAGRAWRAHRYAYEAVVGPIPDGLDLDHLCRVLVCVNPGHLEPVTRALNLQRMWEARRSTSYFASPEDAVRAMHQELSC